MSNEASSRIKFIKTASGAVSLASAIVLLAVPAISNAAGFTFDGVADSDPYSDTFEVKWFNGHKEDESSYPTGHTGDKAKVRIGNGQEGMAGPDFTWLVLEVPLDAKNMVWGPSADPFLDQYDDNLGAGEMDFGKATGSEKAIFGSTALGDGKDASAGQVLLDLAKNKDTFVDNNDDWTVLDFKDSTDYLLGAGGCTLADCGTEPNRTMSFEVKLAALDDAGVAALKTSLETHGVSFHLSPERNGAPEMSEVPVPAAFWLFGTALIGFIGFSRRTTLG